MLTHRHVIAPAFLPESDDDAALADTQVQTPTSLPTDPSVPGLALADLLAAGLARRGWNVDYRWTTYQGNALDARRDTRRYDVEVALKDASPEDRTGRWLITAKPRTGFFKRIFKDEQDPAEHELLRRDIDATLASDPRTSAGGPDVWTDEDHAAA